MLANAKASPHYQVTLRDVYLALAKERSRSRRRQKLVPNPYTNWSEINSALPDDEIEVLGPPPTSGTRDAFNELVMEGGCKTFAWVAALPRDQYLAACHMLRDDGHYIDAGENDNLIVQKLDGEPAPARHLRLQLPRAERRQGPRRAHRRRGAGLRLDRRGQVSGLAAALLLREESARRAIPGIREYVAEFTSDAAVGEFGYLADNGLIPLPDEERAAVQAQAKNLAELHLGNH